MKTKKSLHCDRRGGGDRVFAPDRQGLEKLLPDRLGDSGEPRSEGEAEKQPERV
ncbi:gsl3164 [Gloeobacter violaceus PCC 7421]|uniref:Gsl3164 protein n=1 Tax=Gloeobacter violaceus (strain ATCC 29082 / PCC 7421) TaxID=251221 RepID=Q7NGK5_GLOVI|nr:gsl3164 [Gloeobacter violaceus PCC 7421]